MILNKFSKNLRTRWRIISFVIIGISIVFMFYYAEEKRVPLCIKRTNTYRDFSFKGKVCKKYVDFNHGRRVIEIITKDTIKYYKQSDISGFYEFVKIEDSVVKEKGSLEILVFRDSSKYNFKINFNCNEL